MFEFIGCVIILFVFVLFLICYKLNKYHKADNIYNKTKWICEKHTKIPKYEGSGFGSENLLYYLAEQTRKLKIPDVYKIDFRTEIAYASVILELFRKSESQWLFRQDMNSLTTMDKKWYKISDFDFFMLSLFSFLERNSEYNKIHYHDKIYKYKKREGSYSYYNLTTFGQVYFKIFLITALYCETNVNTKSFISNPQSQYIKENLETKEVSFFHYGS